MTVKKLSLLNNSAFTLIELLIVVLIIGILAAIALPQYQLSVSRARAAQALQNVKTLKDAAEMFLLETGAWPSDINDLAVQISEDENFYYTVNINGILAINKSPYFEASRFEYVRSTYGNSSLKNKFSCVSYNDKWDKVCASFGSPLDNGTDSGKSFKRYALN